MTPSVSVDEELDELLQAPSASGPASARAAPAATPGHFLRNISDPFREIWCRHSPEQGRRNSAHASPAWLLDWSLPDGDRLRAIHGRCPGVITPRCRSYAIGAVGPGACRPYCARTACGLLADRMPVT